VLEATEVLWTTINKLSNVSARANSALSSAEEACDNPRLHEAITQGLNPKDYDLVVKSKS
jgi:hypothetical protein